MWDKLLSATGTVSKQFGSRFLDDGYNSDSDEEGVDTHVIKVLKTYYTTKGEAFPVWLDNQSARPGQIQHVPRNNKASVAGDGLNERGSRSEATSTHRAAKVSLRGVYEQAAERNSTTPALRRGGTKSTSNARSDGDRFVRTSEDSARSMQSANSSNRPQPGLSSSERFRENLKTRRAATRIDSSRPSQTSEQVDGRSKYRNDAF